MNDVIFLVFIALICVAAGFAFGMLLANTRSDKGRSMPDAVKSSPNVTEVVRVVQDRKSGHIFPEYNGKVIRYPADLTPTQRERLAIQLGMLQAWLTPSAPSKEEPAEQQQIPGTGTGPLVKGAATAGALSESLQSTPQATPVKVNPVNMFARVLQSEVRTPPVVQKSIAAQIDEILQEKLTGSPLAGRGIRLMELPSKGLVVMVGLDQYPGVDEVPDPEIRSIIRMSVAEWEERTSTS
jgi:hypothetical protein